MSKQIEPKETLYKRIKFKSRLEARWAVFLDNHFAITEWAYEKPELGMSTGERYTADFTVLANGLFGYVMEIKPELPNLETITKLKEVAGMLKVKFILATGSFYHDGAEQEIPQLHLITRKGLQPAEPIETFFMSPSRAIAAATSHRFDLD